ncbi:MAG: hypothetical protein RJB60_2517, partial [Pseudomonadota bacterium]
MRQDQPGSALTQASLQHLPPLMGGDQRLTACMDVVQQEAIEGGHEARCHLARMPNAHSLERGLCAQQELLALL